MNFLNEIVVALDVGAGWRADLNEGELATKFGMSFKETLDGPETLEDAFGVVDTIYAKPDYGGANSEVVEKFFAIGGTVAGVFGGGFGKGDADGKRANHGDVAAAVDDEAVAVGEGFESAIDAGQEIIAMGLDVEADEVGAKKALEEFALPGANAEGFGVRPGNVPENGNASVGAALFDQARKRRSDSPELRRWRLGPAIS